MKTACEKFREYLENMSKMARKIARETGEVFTVQPGEVLWVVLRNRRSLVTPLIRCLGDVTCIEKLK